ncbi:MAG: hypothetical protein AAB919_00740 [Patescibacteria group bacterium]
MNKQYLYYIGGVAAAVVVSAILAWFIFTGGGAAAPTQSGGTFGSFDNNAVTAGNNGGGTNTTDNINQTTGTQTSQQKIFKISDGPVAGATFVQTFHPTTTLARFVMADNGHAFDLVLDSQGAVPRALSNTTIPGAVSALWVERGAGAVLQYLGATSPKTVYLGFVASSTAKTPATRLQFYPDGIVGLAASPDGSQVAYLLRTAAGTNGFVAKTDGTGGKLLFSLPLAQVQLRWPSPGTLLAYSNAAAGVPGIAFAVDAKTGAVTPLVYAPGLTATADLNFSHVLYQTVQPGATVRTTYSHDVAAGTDRALSFDPFPEQCVQGPLAASVLYCAAPLTYVAPNYLDLWHQGAASTPDSLFSFNLAAGTSTILASPGGSEGGKPTDMLTIAVSPDAHYLLFVSKYDRSLWGVRLRP